MAPQSGIPASRVIEFIERHCRIPEGHAVGAPMVLMGWQREFLVRVFDNPARTRRAILSVGRKNSKSTLIAALMLAYIVGPLAVRNSQVFSAALSREQASLIFGLMTKMVRMDAEMTRHCVIRDSAKELFCTLTGVRFRALSADASTAMGLSPICFCFDEAGQIVGPESQLYTALHTAQGAHREPIEFIISTQAATDADFLSMMIDDAMTGADPQTVCQVYAAPADCDLLDEAAWHAANPSLGQIATVDYVRKMAEEAKRLPSRESQFRNLILNQRVAAENHFLTPTVWALGDEAPDYSVFDDAPVYAGLDLSGRQDLTALVLVARDEAGTWHVKPHFWAPAVGLRDRAERDRAPYDLWREQGHLTATPGSSIDYGFIAEFLGEVATQCDLRLVKFDRWRINDLKRELDTRGIKVELAEHGQGYRDMSPALDVVEAEALNGRLRHGKHPILTWCASNCIVTQDAAGNRKLDKSKATGRIDGMVALAMAMHGASTAPFVASSSLDPTAIQAYFG